MVPELDATLDHGHAVLSFPYDDTLRRLLRAIPGRTWDPNARVWRVPLSPEGAESVGRLLSGALCTPRVSPALATVIRRRRRRRSPEECLVERARPDGDWWLSFCTDIAPELVDALLEHPRGYRMPEIARALIPVDERAAQIVADLVPPGGLRLSDEAARALATARDAGRPAAVPAPEYDVEMLVHSVRRRWILIAGEHAIVARALAARRSLFTRDGPGSSLAVAARDEDATEIAGLLDDLGAQRVDPAVTRWMEHATRWRGTIEVDGPPDAPVFLLVGDARRLPPEIRERATPVPGGAAVPLSLASWQSIDGRLEGWISHAANRCVDALRDGRPAPPAVLQLSSVHDQDTFVLAPGHDRASADAFATLPGAEYKEPARGEEREHAALPALRADAFHVPALDMFLRDRGAWVSPEALGVLQEIREEHARASGLVALSAATDAELRVPELRGDLKPFQRAGVSYVLSQRRVFLADEQGLGKTIQALAAIEADDAYPAVVVCPASLKLNWIREIQRWVPRRTACALSGTRRPVDACGEPADITVVNYDIVAHRMAELRGIGPQALVLDESHYCKNPGAQRTQAAARLAEAVPPDGLVLALTGTPVMNRPPELIAQLRILGRLADFGSGVQFGRRFRGADAHLRLHWHLRARCFARRLKADVLPQLPPKTRSIVPVELDNEPEYRLAERDVIAWLQSQPLDLRELDARVAAALRAERLVRLNYLKKVAARGKLTAALAWIHDFRTSGERLVVFAHHREVHEALLRRFPDALHVLGADSHADRDAAVAAFQAAEDREHQLIVCSMDVAGQGITLTRASNVAFVELGWTPARHDQAEDRCHRIGQHDAVSAWYLLAADTIDETIATLLERKRAVIGAVTDGREEDDVAVVDALARELRTRPYRHLRAVA